MLLSLTEYSRYINEPGVTGVLVDCGLGLEVCPRASHGGRGHICYMTRGEVPFINKAQNCAKSGAVGAIIVNNDPDIFRGTMGYNATSGQPFTTRIPIIGVTIPDGRALLSAVGSEVNFYYPLDSGGYGYDNGTSMA